MADPTSNPKGSAGKAVPPVDEALERAQASVKEMIDDARSAGGGMTMPDFEGGTHAATLTGGLDMLGDVDLQVTVELGRTEMVVEDVLRLNEGSVIELDKLAGDPVDVYVNQRLVARGEVLVLNDNFCIRISEIVDDLQQQAEEAAAQSAGS
ncbi:MAG: flagellar motor switch protein FliN [Phycisphaeraceae bacterium]